MHASPTLTYLRNLDKKDAAVQPMCCCTPIKKLSFIDGITMATFDEVYPFGWHPCDAQVAA